MKPMLAAMLSRAVEDASRVVEDSANFSASLVSLAKRVLSQHVPLKTKPVAGARG